MEIPQEEEKPDQLSLQLTLPYHQPSSLQRLPVRERPIARTLAAPDACNLVELLAILIGGPHQLENAQALLTRFGSLSGLVNAHSQELMNAANGIGPAAAARLKAALELGRRTLVPENENPIIRAPADAAAILQPIMGHLEQEYLYVLLLNTRSRVMEKPLEIYHGSLNASLIRVCEIFRDAVRLNAASIIVAHNHPSGDPSPSPEDVSVTRTMIDVGKQLDIDVMDHLIVSGQSFVSLKERGLAFTK